MWKLDSFKATGKANFKANYWPFVGVSLLLGILTGAFYVDTPEITYHVRTWISTAWSSSTIRWNPS